MNIFLANGKGTALVDKEDYIMLNKLSWWLAPDRSTSYVKTKINGKNVPMHRLILNAPKGMHVDHINGNGLDNRRCNLRLATRSQNRSNTKKISNKTGFKGVYYDEKRKALKLYRAYVKENNKVKTIGYYKTAIEAAKAYDKEAIRIFKEFATLNFKGDN